MTAQRSTQNIRTRQTCLQEIAFFDSWDQTDRSMRQSTYDTCNSYCDRARPPALSPSTPTILLFPEPGTRSITLGERVFLGGPFHMTEPGTRMNARAEPRGEHDLGLDTGTQHMRPDPSWHRLLFVAQSHRITRPTGENRVQVWRSVKEERRRMNGWVNEYIQHTLLRRQPRLPVRDLSPIDQPGDLASLHG